MSARPGASYWYWVEERERDGATHLYGPVASDPAPAAIFQLYLPQLMVGTGAEPAALRGNKPAGAICNRADGYPPGTRPARGPAEGGP